MENKILIDWDGVPNETFKNCPEDLYIQAEAVMELFYGKKRITRNGGTGCPRHYRIEIVRSSSGKGFHGIITIPGKRIGAHRILLAQFLCGSDPKREFLNFQRIQQGVRDWNLLFETKLEEL